MQKFIQSLQTKEMLRKVQRDLKRDADTELKLLIAQVEFLNFAIEARKKLGLSFKPNPNVSELLRMAEEEKILRIQEKFTLSIKGLNESLYNEVQTQKGVHSKVKRAERSGFIAKPREKD